MGWTGQSGGAQKSGSGEITGIEGRQCQLGDAARGLCFHKWSRGREGKLFPQQPGNKVIFADDCSTVSSEFFQEFLQKTDIPILPEIIQIFCGKPSKVSVRNQEPLISESPGSADVPAGHPSGKCLQCRYGLWQPDPVPAGWLRNPDCRKEPEPVKGQGRHSPGKRRQFPFEEASDKARC